MVSPQKRENFNVTPEQERDINYLMDVLDAPTRRDALLRAVSITILLADERKKGNQLFIGKTKGGGLVKLAIPELEKLSAEHWSYLVGRPHPWRRQLYVKGRGLLASHVWNDITANKMSIEQAAENWQLPAEAIEEIIAYCEQNAVLIDMETDEECRRLNELGFKIESQATG